MLKSRDITLSIKFHTVKAMVFPIVVYRCESWTIKTEHQRTDAFKLRCWRRLSRVPWTAKTSNQSILKETNPEYSLKDWYWSSNTLATWCKEWIHWERPLCWEILKTNVPDWGQEEKGATKDETVGWHHWFNEFKQTSGDSGGQGSLACWSPWGCKESDVT